MQWWESIILGIVQGISEFLPISSSGHLIMTRELLPMGGGDFLLFDILLHVGTLLAVAIIFFKDILKLFRPRFKVLGFLALASLPAIGAGLAVGLAPANIRAAFFESARFLWIFFMFTAVILLAAEMIEKKQTPASFIKGIFKPAKKGVPIYNSSCTIKDIKRAKSLLRYSSFVVRYSLYKETKKERSRAPFLPDLKFKHVIAMGLMQAVAIFPGVSRSGSTIFGGIVTKGNRRTIGKFSFLMSIPIILGATLIGEVRNLAGGAPLSPMPIAWYNYVLGIGTAFIVALLSIKLLLWLISKANFKWFSLYLFFVSIFSFVMWFL